MNAELSIRDLWAQVEDKVILKGTNLTVRAGEIHAIRAAISEESGDLLDPAFRKPLIVAIVIALFSQFTGINTIIYYGSLVFLEHVPHQTASTALWANVIIGAINFAATIVGMLLIDRAGRKPLLMSAFAGMALSLVAVSAAIRFQASGIIVLIFVLAYVACFAVGVGTGTWVMMSEICPTRVRGRAMSVPPWTQQRRHESLNGITQSSWIGRSL